MLEFSQRENTSSGVTHVEVNAQARILQILPEGEQASKEKTIPLTLNYNIFMVKKKKVKQYRST